MVKYSIIKHSLTENVDVELQLKSTINRICNESSSTIVVLDSQTICTLETFIKPVSKSVTVREPTLIKQSDIKWSDDSSNLILSLINPWTVQSVPFLPEFKKQIVLSLLEIVQAQPSPDVLFVDQSVNSMRAKMMMLIDICTSLHKSFICANSTLEEEEDSVDRNIETTNDVTVETIDISSRPNWHLYESTLSGDKMVKFEVIQQQVARYIHKTICELDWTDHISEEYIDFIIRVVCAILRERRIPRDIKSIPDTIKKAMAASTGSSSSNGDGVDVSADLNLFGSIAESERKVKPLPTVEEGLSVFEYFSGIGGMRLGLPEAVKGVPIKHIVAYDVSNVANEVYLHNFEHNNASSGTSSSNSNGGEQPKLDSKGGVLKRVSIDGLKLHEVDGKADIWTMSPPCQPYTTTKGANRQDQLDNRSRGIFHLMELLLQMRQLPRWVVLENVRGFLDSNVLQLWKQVIRKCGYRYQQYLLSPDTSVGLPNCRTRYYFIAEHSSSGDSRFLRLFSSRLHNTSDTTDAEAAEVKRARREENSSADGITVGQDGETVHTKLPAHLALSYPTTPLTVREVLAIRPAATTTAPTTAGEVKKCHCSEEDFTSLDLTDRVLSASWSMMLSVVGPHDRQSYCFTKGYGKIFDRSTGSCYYPEAEGPLAEAKYQLDKSDLLPLKGKLRLFDPSEILLLSGFPVEFSWPKSMPLQQRFACIGNSVNVTVVKAVMKCLFDE